jgi:acyl-CoA synthetase (NDP forming)
MREVARTATKPVAATFMGVEGAIPMLAPVPAYRFPEAAVTALAHASEYGQWRQKPAGTTPSFTAETEAARRVVTEALARGAGWLTPPDAQAVLQAMGIAVVATELVRDADDAVARASVIGYPVALKAFGPGMLHKSDVGGVRLDLRDEASLRAAYRALNTLGSRAAGVLIQRMASDGVEMFIGGLQDASFGPVIFCGSGGVLVELFRDAVCRLCPMTDVDAREMLDETRGVARLRGHRGKPPADESALRDALLRVSALLAACPEIQEIDINPVNVLTQGIAVLDVRIRVAPVPEPQPTRRVRY